VLAEYGQHRLLTFDRDPASRTPTVELAHESLLTEWERFASWVDEARDDLLARRRVESAAHDWLAAGSDPSFLYGGGRLELAEAWAAGSRFDLADNERRFLTASRDKVEHDRASRRRRRRRVIAVLATAAVAATAMAAVALVQRRNADEQAGETRARELAGLATLALDEDPERAILLSLAALDRTHEPSAEALSALHRATQATRTTFPVRGEFAEDLVQSPDGSLLAVRRSDRSGYLLIDAATGEIVADVSTAAAIADFGLAFDPTGSTMAVGHLRDEDGAVPAVELVDVTSGRPVGSLTGPPGLYCCSLQYDPSGRWLSALLIGDEGFSAVVWDLAAGGEPLSFGSAYDLELTPDGSSVVVGNGTLLTTFDIATGDQIGVVQGPPGVEYWDFELDASGKLAALVSPGEFARRVDVVELVTGDMLGTIPLRDPLFAQFSPDGKTLAVTAEDSLIRLYDTEEFVKTAELAGTSGPPGIPYFAPDGSRLVTASAGELRMWDISAARPRILGNFQVSGESLDRLVVAADESQAFATVYTDSGLRTSVHRVDLRSGDEVEELSDVPYYFSTRPLVSPDLSWMTALDEDFVTTLVAISGGDSTQLQRCHSVRAFDASGGVAALDAHLVCEERGEETGEGNSRIVELQTDETLVDLGEEFILYAAAFGPSTDGGPPDLAAIEEQSGEVTLYDLATGEALGRYIPDPDWPISIAMSPDGERLVLLMLSGRLVVLDVARLADGDEQTDPTMFDITAHNAGSKGVAVSGSGLIATGSSLDGVRVWSPEGELVAAVPTRQTDAPTFTFAPGTDTLYYEDGGGVVRRFPIDVGELTQLARQLLTRGFTQQECDRYFAGEPCPSFA
jgi:WD40 repeat protein